MSVIDIAAGLKPGQNPVGKLGFDLSYFSKPKISVESFLGATAFSPPAKRYWSKNVPKWPMYGNDDYADCVWAAIAHGEFCWARNTGRAWVPNTSQVIQAYDANTQFDWGKPETDLGTSNVDCMGWWRTQGYADNKILAYAHVNPHNENLVKASINLFGGVWMAFHLPLRINHQNNWVVPSRQDARDIPGSYGGHAVWVPDYGRTGFRCVTWGRVQYGTWGWWHKYAQPVCFAAVSERWVRANGHARNGVNLNRLQELISDVTS